MSDGSVADLATPQPYQNEHKFAISKKREVCNQGGY